MERRPQRGGNEKWEERSGVTFSVLKINKTIPSTAGDGAWLKKNTLHLITVCLKCSTTAVLGVYEGLKMIFLR